MDSLRSLAVELDVPERTLRRAAAEGLIRGERISPRKFRTSVREQDYLRRHWQLLTRMRELLRTEPNVAFAALYGSFATGSEGPTSDIDLAVELREDDLARLADLSGRLTRSLGRDVQTAPLSSLRETPTLLLDLLSEGRVLVDRAGTWERLKGEEHALRKRAAGEPSLEDLAASLDLDETTR